MPDRAGAQEAGLPMYTNGFLPAVYQPTMFRPGQQAGAESRPAEGRRRWTSGARRIDLIRRLNEANLPGEDPEFAARISAYDTAFKMQTEAPEVFDISKEPQETLDLYGVGEPKTDDYGRRCLLARRMVEKGVRFVCVVSGGGAADTEWDAHSDIEENHIKMASQTDKPVAGADQGSEAARHARFHARAVGRRVRPVAGIGEEQGPRPPQHRLLACGWPAAASRAARSTAPPTPSA